VVHVDSTHRFSNRVDDYVKYRPSYPREAIDFLLDLGLNQESRIADVGSGTGILTELLLEHVGQVYAIEPNDEMRAAAVARLGVHDRFVSVAATAEVTTLPNRSVDLVTAAQAFHWFDTTRSLAEFRRILRSPGRLCLRLLVAYRSIRDGDPSEAGGWALEGA
jgi:ubiquinone/menaquinone biosynthesis C-methylase UbiE